MFDKKEYNKKYWKKYYQEHKESHLENTKVWQKTEEGKLSCRKSYEKWYKYKKNRKHRLEYIKEYREDNPEYQKLWWEDNPEYMKQWRKTDKGKANSQRTNVTRKTREENIINTLTFQEWLEILKKYHLKCAYCGKEFDLFDRPTRDHVIPISKGGDNVKENIVPACRSCNSKKYNKILYKGEKIK